MIKRVSDARRRRGAGFTLIELLVVIVILGILSAVVVFAVQGVGDKGSSAAKATDLQTVRTAEESFCAKVGRYGTERQLAGIDPASDGQTYKFLSEESATHNVALNTQGGQCGGTSYSVFSQAAGMTPSRPLRVAVGGFENNLTPFTTPLSNGSLVANNMVALVYDSLLWSADVDNPEAWLAESMTPSTDFKTWTIKLRPGIKWHDSTDAVPRFLTANDVKFTYDYFKARGPAAGGRYTHHVTDFPQYASAAVIDDQTVALSFASPAPAFPNLPAADLPIVPKHIWETITAPTLETTRLPIGSGPFKLTEIKANQAGYKFQANADYFKGKPLVDFLDITVVSQQSAAFAALKTGQIDIVGSGGVPAELLSELQGSSGVEVKKGTWYESSVLNFNARKAPLTDPKIRKAISLAIDNQALVDTVLLGNGRIGPDGFVHQDSPYARPPTTPTTPVHEFNVTRANELLDAAGYTTRDTDGVRKTPGGQRLEFTVLTQNTDAAQVRAGQIIAGAGGSPGQVTPASIGVKLNPLSVDPATLNKARRCTSSTTIGDPVCVPTFDIYINTIGAHFSPDPDGLYWYFHSPPKLVGEKPKGISAAFTGYGNPTVDTLLEAAVLMTKEARKPKLYEVQAILAEEAPTVVLWNADNNNAFRPEAYDGWIADPSQGIFTKRSFLSQYAGR